MVIVIDATNIGAGGGITHLKQILANYSLKYKVILIAQTKLLNYLPEYEFLTKKSHRLLNKTLVHRVIFQLFMIDSYIPKNAIVFSITGDFLGRYKPVVSLSQNMLLYERSIWRDIKSLKEIIRFWINFQKQKISFRNSAGIIFLSNYSKTYISEKLSLKNKAVRIIHHGISDRFVNRVALQNEISDYSFSNPFKLLYVSTVHVYKHQWNVVEAVAILRSKGYPVALDLVGEVIFLPSGELLSDTISKVDPNAEFIIHHGHLPHDEIDSIYKASDGFVYASTCENMPNILIEMMASGKPIACSDKQPMPEFLKENGFYFNACNVTSIVNALEDMLNDTKRRAEYSKNNLQEIKQYNWLETANNTFNFITEIYNSIADDKK